MLSFYPDELVWAIQREREQDLRAVLPHTKQKPESERHTHERQHRHDTLGLWVSPALRADLT
jgi:hypothetical protein